MQSKKSVKSDEESSAKRTLETSEDPVGLKETCPFQTEHSFEIHCRSDCAWYSLDKCCIWDLIDALMGIRRGIEARLEISRELLEIEKR